jgi:predicted nucleic acid-binding protein
VPSRKDRVPVVFDTNVVVGYYLSRNPNSARAKVFRLWRYERKLQLIVSADVVAEYAEVLARSECG